MSSLVRAGENDGKFHRSYEEEIADFLPENIARTAALPNNCKKNSKRCSFSRFQDLLIKDKALG